MRPPPRPFTAKPMPQRILQMTAFLLFAVATSTLAAADPPPPEVTKLVGQLKSTNATNRLKAVTALGDLKEKAADATDALATVAQRDPDPGVQNAAWKSLTAIQVATHTAGLKDADGRVRLKAAKELGKLKARGKGAIDELARAAEKDSEDDVRSAAQKSLEVIKEAAQKVDVIAPFIKGVQSKKPAERIEALDQFAKLGEKAQGATAMIVSLMMDNTPAVREAAAACMEKVDPKLHKHVVAILYDNNSTNKTDAEEALAKLGERAEGAVPALKYRWSITVADAGESTLRLPDYTALVALVCIVPDDAQVANEVLRLLASPYRGGFDGLVADNNRLFAFRLIDHLPGVSDAKKVAALSTALSAATLAFPRDDKSQLIAIEKLVKYGAEAKPALPALMKLKLAGNEDVRKAAVKAVETISAAK